MEWFSTSNQTQSYVKTLVSPYNLQRIIFRGGLFTFINGFTPPNKWQPTFAVFHVALYVTDPGAGTSEQVYQTTVGVNTQYHQTGDPTTAQYLLQGSTPELHADINSRVSAAGGANGPVEVLLDITKEEQRGLAYSVPLTAYGSGQLDLLGSVPTGSRST
jgi:hypothetical protein